MNLYIFGSILRHMFSVQTKYQLLLYIGYLFLAYPLDFIQKSSPRNIFRFFRALAVEPSNQIAANVSRFITSITDSEGLKQWEHFKIIHSRIERFLHLVKEKNAQNQKCCLLVTHETTRTGAPLIIYRLAEHFKYEYGLFVIFIACKGGELREEFSIHFLHISLIN